MTELDAGFVGTVLDDMSDKRTGRGMELMRQRTFGTQLEMRLAGAAMFPDSREEVNRRLTEYWERTAAGNLTLQNSSFAKREVIIGAGLHAGVYALNRVLAGFPKPVVLERAPAGNVGGCWAWSLNPVFRLNSRNRPDFMGQGAPDQGGALNFIPGSPLQPAMMSSEEYPDNSLIAWLVRVLLGLCADVYPGRYVTSGDASAMRLTLAGGTELTCGRILDARGLGDPDGENPSLIPEGGVMSFPRFMARMGRDFPLRGLNQVAVIGGGNSGACACESLLGIAPGHTSPAGLDWVQSVDWYTGSRGIQADCNGFRLASRGRYLSLGQYTEGNTSNRVSRLRIFRQQAAAAPLQQGAFCAGRTYDLAVQCTGFTRPSFWFASQEYYPSQEQKLSVKVGGRRVYRIGPAADIQFDSGEDQSNPANKVAIFRLAPRTAALARMLPAVP